MGRRDLAGLARRVDAVYTELTNLQRELVAAVRGGQADAPFELRERAEAVIAGMEAAQAGLAVGRLSRPEAEAAALRARVLALPLDPNLLMAAMRAQPRRYAFPLLAEALRLAIDEDALEALADCSLGELLSAPRGMGQSTARRLLAHFEVGPDDTPPDLDRAALSRVIDGLHAAATELPDGVGLRARHAGRK
ncbi:MAG TPA: hypothetical protein VNT54_00590, partial [Solirubrobacteraceae bacterium]|nr:hypothetical protein [Solirubrobacteraceae bacterium]